MSWNHARLSTLLLSLICFLLPWVEIRCDHPEHQFVVVRQSGLQVALGQTTVIVGGEVVHSGWPEEERAKWSEPPPAGGLTLYALALLAALCSSQWMRPSESRWWLVTLSSSVACVALVVQLLQGFPVAQDTPPELVHYQIWLWIALAATLITPVLSCCERLFSAPQADSPFGDQTFSRPTDSEAWP